MGAMMENIEGENLTDAIKKAKEKCQDGVMPIIKEFENITGLTVTSISMIVKAGWGDKVITTGVEINTTL